MCTNGRRPSHAGGHALHLFCQVKDAGSSEQRALSLDCTLLQRTGLFTAVTTSSPWNLGEGGREGPAKQRSTDFDLEKGLSRTAIGTRLTEAAAANHIAAKNREREREQPAAGRIERIGNETVSMILNRGRKLSNAEIGEVTFQKSSSHPVAVVEREAGEAEGERRGAGCRCNGGATFPRCLSRPPPAWSPAAMEGKEQGRERGTVVTRARARQHSKPISETEVSQAVITRVPD